MFERASFGVYEQGNFVKPISRCFEIIPNGMDEAAYVLSGKSCSQLIAFISTIAPATITAEPSTTSNKQ